MNFRRAAGLGAAMPFCLWRGEGFGRGVRPGLLAGTVPLAVGLLAGDVPVLATRAARG